MKSFLKKITLTCCLIFISTASIANGVSPYLPLKMDNLIELEINRLASISQMPNLSKPYHIVTVVEYLDKVKYSHPQLYNRLTNYIRRYKKQSGITQVAVKLSHSFSNNKIVPNSRGQELNDTVQFSFASFHQFNKYFIANGGGTYSDSTGFVPHNSYLSVGTEYIQFDLGYREHWLSPAQESTQLLSTNAEPIPSITVSNVKAITDFNIKYEVSFGLLKKMDGIHFDGKTSSGKPGFLTMHVSAQPFDWWTIGANRSFMFGGGDRSVSLKSIWDAFIDPVSSDNCGGDSDLQNCNEEVGNQIASILTKFDFSIYDFPISIYAEYGGEDTKNFKTVSLGNLGATYGLFIPYLTSDISLYLEYSSFHSHWYVHHIYDEGYSNNNHIMGHWWGENKKLKDITGANVSTARINWDFNSQNHVEVIARTVKNNPSTLVEYKRLKELEINYKRPYKSGFINLSLNAGKDIYGDSFSRLSIGYNW